MKKDVVIVLYGSTGDLTFRKLLPAITELYIDKKISPKTTVLAVGRREFTTEQYLDFVYEKNEELNLEILKEVVHYHQMQITDKNDYEPFKEILEKYCDENTQVIHYLAIAPELMVTVTNLLNTNQIIEKNNVNQRIIFEKPFGHNYQSAQQINTMLWKNFDEKQIYRMDHYLGKTVISELLNIRFNNSVFKNMLKPSNLKQINVVVKEEVGVLNRGNYYDGVGATKDMFQSHLLQMVALLTMDKPKRFKTENIIKEKVKVFRKLNLKKENLIFGQYNGYLLEENIPKNSLTETLISANLKINNKFNDVEISVLTGKAMSEKTTYIKYLLKDGSEVTFSMFPNNKITLKTNLLSNSALLTETIDVVANEYALLLLGAIESKKEMFVSGDEIEFSWRFVDELLKHKKELVIYNKELEQFDN